MCSLRVQTLLRNVQDFLKDWVFVLYWYFRIFHFYIVELWVLVNLIIKKKDGSVFRWSKWSEKLILKQMDIGNPTDSATE